MKGYTTLVFGLLRLGFQSAQLERMRGEAANQRTRDAVAPKRPHLFIDLVPDDDE